MIAFIFSILYDKFIGQILIPDWLTMSANVPSATSFAPWRGTGKWLCVMVLYQMSCLLPCLTKQQSCALSIRSSSLVFIRFHLLVQRRKDIKLSITTDMLQHFITMFFSYPYLSPFFFSVLTLSMLFSKMLHPPQKKFSKKRTQMHTDAHRHYTQPCTFICVNLCASVFVLSAYRRESITGETRIAGRTWQDSH